MFCWKSNTVTYVWFGMAACHFSEATCIHVVTEITTAGTVRNALSPCCTEVLIYPSRDWVMRSKSSPIDGPMVYWYSTGRDDCSLHQRTLCKALYGINMAPLLQLHVVFRRRNNGKMMTIISNSTPNQILGEDYEEYVGDHSAYFGSKHTLSKEDDRLLSETYFNLFCLGEEIDEAVESIPFSMLRIEADGVQDSKMDYFEAKEDSFAACFCFIVSDQEVDKDIEEEGVVLWAMRSWKWD